MTETPPTPPTELSADLVDELAACSPRELREGASYAEALATYRDRDQPTQSATGPDGADRPDDVPAKATLTVKEINDNRYYYWQWRDGERVRSQYAAPVNPDR